MISALNTLAQGLLRLFGKPPRVKGWYAGPQIGFRNYSDVELRNLPDGVLQFALYPTGIKTDLQIDALCLPVSSLPRSLTIEYELGGTVHPSEADTAPLISIAFQRKHDNWTGEGKYQQYRWYAAQANELVAGDGVLAVNFDSPRDWTDVSGQPALASLAAFSDARQCPGTVFITFGHSAGRSHGVIGAGQFKLIKAVLA